MDPAYAPQLGARLRMTNTQLNLIGAAGNFGFVSGGPVWGRIVDKRGPRIPLALGCIFLFSAYSGLRFIFEGGLPKSFETMPTSLFCLVALLRYIAGLGSNAGFMAAMNSTAKSFPDKMRASVVSLVVSGLGLSALLFSTLAHLVHAGNPSLFLFLLSVGAAAPALIGFFLIRPIPLPTVDGTATLETCQGESRLPPGEDFRENDRTPLLRRSTLIRPHNRKSTALQKGEFWLLFWLFAPLAGTGLMFINNVGTIARALYLKESTVYDPIQSAKWQLDQVSILSLMNFCGRIFVGPLSDFLKTRYSAPRSYCIVLVSSLFFASQVVAANIDHVQTLWIASAMAGFSHGTAYALFPMVCLDWFGMANFSENWGYNLVASIVGCTLFSLVFGKNLDAHTPEDSQCREGRMCYVAALYLTSAACFVAILLSLRAGWRDRRKTMITQGVSQ